MDIFSRFAELCTRPSGRIGRGRVAFEGIAPPELSTSVGISLEEIVRWIGNDTSERSQALDAVTGRAPATFKKVIWASHFLERVALECEVRALDHHRGRAKEKGSVKKASDRALRQEVLARRFGVFKTIRSISEEIGREVGVSSSNTAPELLAELGKVIKVRKDRALFEKQQNAYKAFNMARKNRKFFGSFPEFQRREAAKRRRNAKAPRRPSKPKPAPVTIVTVEADQGETKVTETKVSRSVKVVRRRTFNVVSHEPHALN